MIKEDEEASQMLETLVNTKKVLSDSKLTSITDQTKQIFSDIRRGIEELNLVFYGCREPEGSTLSASIEQAMNGGAPLAIFYAEFDKWQAEFKNNILRLESSATDVDYKFAKLMLRVNSSDVKALKEHLIQKLMHIKSKSEKNYSSFISFCNKFSYFWGTIDPASDDYSHFTERLKDIKENADKYEDLYASLSDYRSKKVMYGILRFWTELDFSFKNTLSDKLFDPYFDHDIIGMLPEDAVFVDCGAYKGDTALNFVNNFNKYKKMYLYEIVPLLVEKEKEALKNNHDVIFRNAGVGDLALQNSTVLVANNPAIKTTSLLDRKTTAIYEDPSAIGNKPDLKVPVKMTTIDHDIAEKISFIKMDVEGAELAAINGAMNHIRMDRPVLAICSYHRYSDMWKIPELIRSIDPGYRFYMRYYGTENGYMASEFVLYARP